MPPLAQNAHILHTGSSQYAAFSTLDLHAYFLLFGGLVRVGNANVYIKVEYSAPCLLHLSFMFWCHISLVLTLFYHDIRSACVFKISECPAGCNLLIIYSLPVPVELTFTPCQQQQLHLCFSASIHA